MKKKTIFAWILAGIVCTVPGMTAFAGQWVPVGTQWKYQGDDGQFLTNCWQWIDGNGDGISESYRFDENGILYVSASVDGYMVNENGAWVENNIVQTQSKNGWYQSGGQWRYRTNSGDVVNTWKTINGSMYYFDELGNMVTGFQNISGSGYYFNPGGDLQKKTFLLEGVYYVIPDKDGVIEDEVNEFDWSDYKREGNDTGSGNSSKSSGSSPSGSSNSTNRTPDVSSVDTSDYAYQVFELVNQERVADGQSELAWDDGLAACAQTRAEETVEKFSHTRPNGTSCFTILSENGISGGYKGENIAKGQTTPKRVMNSWMNSSGHKKNILKSNFENIGVGCYEQGGTLYWVQLFTSN